MADHSMSTMLTLLKHVSELPHRLGLSCRDFMVLDSRLFVRVSLGLVVNHLEISHSNLGLQPAAIAYHLLLVIFSV